MVAAFPTLVLALSATRGLAMWASETIAAAVVAMVWMVVGILVAKPDALHASALFLAGALAEWLLTRGVVHSISSYSGYTAFSAACVAGGGVWCALAWARSNGSGIPDRFVLVPWTDPARMATACLHLRAVSRTVVEEEIALGAIPSVVTRLPRLDTACERGGIWEMRRTEAPRTGATSPGSPFRSSSLPDRHP